MSAAYWFTTDCENGASEVLWEDGERVCRRTRRAGPDGVRQNVTLAPLALGELAQLVRDSLQIDHERVRPLIEVLHEKTQGNPFFAIQFLTELADESLLVFNLREQSWQWDLDRIFAKKFTDNIVAFMEGRVRGALATRMS